MSKMHIHIKIGSQTYQWHGICKVTEIVFFLPLVNHDYEFWIFRNVCIMLRRIRRCLNSEKLPGRSQGFREVVNRLLSCHQGSPRACRGVKTHLVQNWDRRIWSHRWGGWRPFPAPCKPEKTQGISVTIHTTPGKAKSVTSGAGIGY